MFTHQLLPVSLLTLTVALVAGASSAVFAPRDVTVDAAGRFVNSSGSVVLLKGTNVVVKGPPWIPSVNSTERCGQLSPNSSVCRSFNEADARFLLAQGMNLIRLGVIWAGGQPTPQLVLDPDFTQRLGAILELCHKFGIRVVLDLHQDAMATATCGEGVPMWYINKYLPQLIGAPVVGPKSKLRGACSVLDSAGWKLFAGDPLYNVKNDCCTKINVPGPWGVALDPSVGVQLTFAHLVGTMEGRAAYAAYVGLLAAAVADYPAAVGIELMNEPPFWQHMPFEASTLYQLFRQCYEAVRAVSAEMAVGVADSGQVPRYRDDSHLNQHTRDWLRSTNTTHLMYTFHHYGSGYPPFNQSIANAKALASLWHAAPVMTEFGWDGRSADGARDSAYATSHGVHWTYYEYDSYCNVPNRGAGSSSNCTPGDACSFGACIT